MSHVLEMNIYLRHVQKYNLFLKHYTTNGIVNYLQFQFKTVNSTHAMRRPVQLIQLWLEKQLVSASFFSVAKFEIYAVKNNWRGESILYIYIFIWYATIAFHLNGMRSLYQIKIFITKQNVSIRIFFISSRYLYILHLCKYICFSVKWFKNNYNIRN